MASSGLSPMDPSSFSRPGKYLHIHSMLYYDIIKLVFILEFVRVTNISLKLDVNFQKKIFTGSVDLTANKVDETASELVGKIFVLLCNSFKHLSLQILDSKDLTIENIYDVDLNKTLNFEVGKAVGEFGSKLTITLLPKESNQ